ncbi:threonine synthase [candidate division KSB1 bacterium]|nr:threonine synthase [candidate division KSB1 bacterium]
MKTELLCTSCGKFYPENEPVWRCACGGYFDLKFKAGIKPDVVSVRKPNLWRYREVLPVINDDCIVTFDEGYTSLVPVRFGRCTVFLKQDQLFPTGSFKDRGASVMVSKMKELGIRRVVEDSSGNAGCAVAAYCASAGIDCTIYVPESTSPGKTKQIESYGARLVKVPGDRDQTARETLKAAKSVYYASHVWNPYFFHGLKTFAYEVCEQLAWHAPDVVILPVGNGSLLLGAFLGFNELLSDRVIDQMPVLIGVQAALCPPLARAFDAPHGKFEKPSSRTLAEGIAICEPLRALQILNAVRLTNGRFITVTEEEIVTSLRKMGERGFYIEPTAAATMAAVEKYCSSVNDDRVIVSVVTGHGLKAAGKI